jgi:uncharacterized protein
MSYENKILQMKKLLGKKKEVVQEKPVFQKPDAPVYRDAWERAGLQSIENEFGVLFVRKVEYPYSYKHGSYTLGQFFSVLRLWEQTKQQHPFAISPDEKVIFYDTETTGLKGTGTHIFLNGLLEDTGESFLLTQYVLADPSNEAAFLFESKFWRTSSTVVSYNGKSFDWPQLETRWTLNKPHLPPLKQQRQVDLLHSSKRLWRNDLEAMKLTKVEAEKLGFHRVGDIPGHLAPIIYFDAVKSGNATSLMKVLKHNEWDLLSLITLYIHSTKLLFEHVEESSTTKTNIGKWYSDLKYASLSKQHLIQVTEEFSEADGAVAHYYLGLHYKREKLVIEALKSFEIASQHTAARMRENAFLNMAILYEHEVKDFAAALTMTYAGLAIAEADPQQTKAKSNRLNKWEIRKQRLENKIYFPGKRN